MLFLKIKLLCLLIKYRATKENKMFETRIPPNLPVTPKSTEEINVIEIKKVVNYQPR